MKKPNTKTEGAKIIPFVIRCDLLIVEDDLSTRNVIGKIIRSRFPNLKIQSAEDGLEGLKKVKAFNPRIVWANVVMPRVNGLEMIELIRQDPARKKTRIIVCTGCTGSPKWKDVKTRAIELGVSRFFPKPFDVEEALSAIEECLT